MSLARRVVPNERSGQTTRRFKSIHDPVYGLGAHSREISMQSPLSDMFEPDGSPDAAELSMASAAYAVLTGTRRATRLDLLLSTVVELLNVGGLTTSEIHQAVADAWPGSDIALADVEEALSVAASAGQQLVVKGERASKDQSGISVKPADSNSKLRRVGSTVSSTASRLRYASGHGWTFAIARKPRQLCGRSGLSARSV